MDGADLGRLRRRMAVLRNSRLTKKPTTQNFFSLQQSLVITVCLVHLLYSSLFFNIPIWIQIRLSSISPSKTCIVYIFFTSDLGRAQDQTSRDILTTTFQPDYTLFYQPYPLCAYLADNSYYPDPSTSKRIYPPFHYPLSLANLQHPFINTPRRSSSLPLGSSLTSLQQHQYFVLWR
jgi:hypothetical protein